MQDHRVENKIQQTSWLKWDVFTHQWVFEQVNQNAVPKRPIKLTCCLPIGLCMLTVSRNLLQLVEFIFLFFYFIFFTVFIWLFQLFKMIFFNLQISFCVLNTGPWMVQMICYLNSMWCSSVAWHAGMLLIIQSIYSLAVSCHFIEASEAPPTL